jgi:PAS domain S-box-containing protein
MAEAEHEGEQRTPEQMLADVREYALSNILWPLFAVGGAIALVTASPRWLAGDYLLLSIYLAIYATVILITLTRGGSFRLRAVALVGVLALLSIMEVHSYGKTGLFGATLLAMVLLTAILFNHRAGLTMLGVSALFELVYAFLYLNGYIAVVRPSQAEALEPYSWFTFIAIFGFMGAGAMLTCTHIIERVVALAFASVEATKERDARIRETEELQKRLREREQRYESFLHSTSDGVWCYEFRPGIPIDLPVEEQVERILDGVLVECNQQCAVLYGVRDMDSALGRTFKSFVLHPDYLREILTNFVCNGYRVNREELSLRSSRGGTRYFENTASGIVHEGRLVRLWGTFREVTEVRVAARQRQAAQDRFTALVRNIPGAVYMAHRVGAASKMLFLSEGIAAITGRTAAETLRMSPEEVDAVVHPDDRMRVHRELEERFARMQPYTQEYRVVRPDGEVRWVLDRGQGRRREGMEGIFVEGVIIDVTARHEAEERLRRQEEQLRQAQKMEAIGQLAGGIAHDFNNILQGILGFSDVALQSKDLPPETAELFRHISRSAERAAALVRQLLMFSRRMEAQPEYLDLGEQVCRTSELLKRILGAQVRLELETGQDVCCVYADASQMEQVVINLAVNARDAMPEGGILRIRVEAQHLAEDRARAMGLQPGDYVRLTVSDTGVGMDRQMLAHIFEPFFTTKALGKGTGLGLATVYGIVQRYGGAIEARSEVGLGSTFEILLPREKVKPGTPPEAVPVREAELAAATILLAEDEPLVRAATSQMLSNAGYSVVEAVHGAEGLQLFQRNPGAIDLAVLDVVMPEMGGVELLEALRGLKPSLPVVLLTGYAEIPPAGMGAAPVAMLQKPVRAKELLDKVSQLLEKARNTRHS